MTTARSIDYWGIVTRSAGIAWNHRFLWFFGFFAASGGGGGGNTMNWKDHGVDEIRDFFMSHIGMMVAIIMGLVLLWLVLFVLNLISKGALLSCISRADDGERIRFEEGWNAGIRAFWGMLGIAVAALVVFLVVSAVCVLAVVLPLIGGAAGIAIAVFIGVVLFIPYIVFLFLLAFTVIYAEREYVIAGGGVADALSAGWNLTKTCFWQSLHFDRYRESHSGSSAGYSHRPRGAGSGHLGVQHLRVLSMDAHVSGSHGRVRGGPVCGRHGATGHGATAGGDPGRPMGHTGEAQ